MAGLAAALGVGFVALAYLVVRMRIELRQLTVLLRGALEVLPAAVPGGGGHPPSDWPQEAAIQPGATAPPPLRTITDGGWALALLVREPGQLDVLPEVNELGRLRSRYQLVIGISDGHDPALSPGIPVVTLPDALYDHLPSPSAAMIDPEGIVQGIGPVADSFELLAFVHEGEHHGFGPAEILDNAVQQAG
jgi:hypothetical protein